MIDEQLATRRCYRRKEAAQVLNIKETWLKRWVTARCMPHQRSGNPDGKQQRGVWFTWADILAIGEMLPELMTPRQAKRTATADPGAPEPVSAAVVDQWVTLALRRDQHMRERSSRRSREMGVRG